MDCQHCSCCKGTEWSLKGMFLPLPPVGSHSRVRVPCARGRAEGHAVWPGGAGGPAGSRHAGGQSEEEGEEE